jgi:hypothetical protein
MASTADFRRDRVDDHPAASDSTAASTAQTDPRQTSQPKNLLRCFQILFLLQRVMRG